MDFSSSPDQLAIRDGRCETVRKDSTRSTGSIATQRRFSGGLLPCGRAGRLARHRHAAAIRRRGTGHHRSRTDDAGHQRIGSRLLRRIGRAHEHLRTQSRGGVRNRTAEEPLAAAAHPRRAESLLRRHRAGRRPQHGEDRHDSAARGERYILRGQKIWISTAQVADKMLVLARTAAAGRQADRRLVAVLHRSGPALRRSARDRQDGAQGGRFEPALHRGASGAGGRSHRRGRQGLRVHPARPESGAHPDRRRGDRTRPRGTAARGRLCEESASSSIGRSVRTRPSSIRWRAAGWNSRRRI